MIFPLQLPLPLLPPHLSYLSSPSSPMFPSLSFSLLSSSQPPPPWPRDLPLRSPHSLLLLDLDPDPDLDLDLNLVVDAPEAAVPLDLFLLLIRGGYLTRF